MYVPRDDDSHWSIDDKAVKYHNIASWITSFLADMDYTRRYANRLFEYWEERMNVRENDK